MSVTRPNLGKYVTFRDRRDGAVRVFFQIPKENRPSGWPSAIRLPVDCTEPCYLTDRATVERIKGDAARLYAQSRRAFLAERRLAISEELRIVR